METYGLNVGEDNRRGISWHAHKQALVSGVAEHMQSAMPTSVHEVDGNLRTERW